ncbi:predicted protein [Nematostella vectensis]|uniref:Anion exchange protein n=1 Tax=Nematostella vectensis TaxID=45351 RepID=A7SWX4_NEMVE|nr:predicted protein [Nematostella vectensis]|eukprot:XP_001623893.1 predicted protein [Nematostella vectensis]
MAFYGEEEGLSLHEGFVELEELSCSDDKLIWKETARWIKFEEDVEKNANRWGKPHIPCLGFHSCQEVRTVFQNGCLLLDLDEDQLPSIAEAVASKLISDGKLSEKEHDAFLSILLTPHEHQFQKQRSGGGIRKLSTIHPIGKEQGRNTNQNDFFSILFSSIPHVEIATKPGGNTSRAQDSLAVDTIDNKVSSIDARIPKDAEATTVLVGGHKHLSAPEGAFVRLARGCRLRNLAEVNIPVRFLFILLGPDDKSIDYHEVGRCVATLMSDRLFLDCAYDAEELQDLYDAMDSFLSDTVIIPPGEWDRNVLAQSLPSLAKETKKTALRRRGALLRKQRHFSDLETQETVTESLELEDDPLKRTGLFCGGLLRDVKRRFPYYKSDMTDSFNWRCVMATILVYVACLAPAISFGGLLYKKTKGWMGVAEMIVSTALSGVIFALFAGQPLIIIGATGPLLLFETNVFNLSESFDFEYMPWRAWVGIWVMLICWALVAMEGCFLIRYFTRFTEEIFACMISLIFIYDGIKYIYDIFGLYPLTSGTTENVDGKDVSNTALFTTILFFGTFFVAHIIRDVRHSRFLNHTLRRVISDFGVLIAIVAMILVELSAQSIYVQRLNVPDGFDVTSPHLRGWYVNPMGTERRLGADAIFGALVPAILVSILVFMEVEFCNVILDKKDNQLKKGPGYNLDLFVVGFLMGMCSVLGLPWMCATPVHTVSHLHALMVHSTNHAPGEHPQLLEVKEQRVTNIIIHVLIGLTMLLAPVIRLTPVVVLFGVFVHLGFSSLSHLQFVERFKLLFVSPNHHPDRRYVRSVSTGKMNAFTLVQVVCLLFLVAIKVTVVAPFFPFFVICLVPLRRMLERFYTDQELEDLDNEEEEYLDSDLDEFDMVHVPI